MVRVARMGRCAERSAFPLPERVPLRADAARGAAARGALELLYMLHIE